MRISAAIHPLVMVKHRQKRALEVARPLQDLQSDFRVGLHQLPLRVVKRVVLVEDGAWESQLPDVVQQAGAREDALPRLGHAHLARALNAQLASTAVVRSDLAV